MVIIRKFEPRDAEAVSSLIRDTMRASNTADYSLERLQPLMDYFSPEKVLQISEERYCLVAEEGAQIIATAAIGGSELSTFFVHPRYERLGIGSRLLEVIEAAVGEGIEVIRVESSVTGAGFYERKGYRRTGREKEGTAGRQIEMEKRIN